jgi:pyruvate/2-oxoglutarate dehydrogenase complex dihydrolipoamide dehydrogenase (E3) component
LPEHLIIIGGGPIGVEMAQAFCRLGSQITLVTDVERLLPRDEPQASELIQAILRSEGVTIHLNNSAVSASTTEGHITVTLADGTTLSGSHVLVAIGKHSDVRNLNPDAAGLKHDNGRLLISDTLRTSQKHIFAAGDIVGAPLFTHAALSEGVIALTNSISPLATKRKKHMPWTTFTDPEIAHAGMTESQAKAVGKSYEIIHMPITRVDRAMTDGKRQGFIKLIHAPNGRLYGATIVGHNAGEMMNEWAQLIERKGRISEVASAIHIYPTMGFSNTIIASVHLRRYLEQSLVGKIARRVVGWLI